MRELKAGDCIYEDGNKKLCVINKYEFDGWWLLKGETIFGSTRLCRKMIVWPTPIAVELVGVP